MQISDQPAVIHVAHDMLDGIESAPERRNIMHREYDTGHDHDHQHDACEGSIIPKIIQIPWRRVFVQLMVQKSEDRQPIIDPADDRIRKLCTAHCVIFCTLRCHSHSTQLRSAGVWRTPSRDNPNPEGFISMLLPEN